MSGPEAAPAIAPGDLLVIMDAEGQEYEAEALSGVETTRTGLFSVVWVNRPLDDGQLEPMPWPADSVRLAKPSDFPGGAA